MRYFYFVSYAHTTGFGSLEVSADTPIFSMKTIAEIVTEIKRCNPSFGGVVVLNFILLRTEDAS